MLRVRDLALRLWRLVPTPNLNAEETRSKQASNKHTERPLRTCIYISPDSQAGLTRERRNGERTHFHTPPEER